MNGRILKSSKKSLGFKLTAKPDYPAAIIETLWGLIPRHYAKWLTEVVHGIARKSAIREFSYPKGVVIDGPFAGTLVSGRGSSWNQELDSVSTIFGLYENEVTRRIIEVAKSGSFETFVHVGCSSGVLACGLLRSKLFSRAALIDIDPQALQNSQSNARLNGLTDCTFSDKFSAEDVSGTALFLIDIEGEELTFFDSNFDALLDHVLLFELHEKGSNQADKASQLLDRLEMHYELDIFGSGATTGLVGSAFAEAAGHLSDYERFCLVSEGRSHLQRWVLCTPRNQN